MSEDQIVFKLLTFNIQHGRGMNDVVNLERTAAIIENSGADIVALQEVDRNFSERSGFEDQYNWLKKRLGMYGTFGANVLSDQPSPAGTASEFGNAILSKHPIEHSENICFNVFVMEGQATERRGVLKAEIKINGEKLTVFNTHFALDENEQCANVRETLEWMQKNKGPKILTGDLNALPESLTLQLLEKEMKDAFVEAGTNQGYTFPAPYDKKGEKIQPNRRIDYILTDPCYTVQEIQTIVTDTSDHLPILAKLKLNKKMR